MFFSKNLHAARAARRASRRGKALSTAGNRLRFCGVALEPLEERMLLTVSLDGIPNWFDLGPSPILNAEDADPDRTSGGGIEAIAVDPNNAARIFVGSINGGIWRTLDGNRPFDGVDNDGANGVDDPLEQPSWTPLTDQLPSLAIGDVRFDPLDATNNTLFAGTGSASSLTGAGGPAIGVLKTIDGGNTWRVIPVNPGAEPQIRAVLPTTFDTDAGTAGVQQAVLVGTTGGVYRSTNGGQTYGLISGTNGLPAGAVTHLVIDPNNASRVYTGVAGQGVFRSDNGGGTWTPANTNLTGLATSTAIELAVHPGGGSTVVYAIVSGPNPAVFSSNNGGANWTPLAALPASFTSNNNGLYASAAQDQIVVDPTNSQIVYVSKGYGGGGFMFRYNPAGGGSWVQIETAGAAGNTAPHVDNRDLKFAGNNVLLDANDGGIYFLRNPQNAAANRWTSLHGRESTALNTGELHDIAWDSTFNVVSAGAQDNGTSVQSNQFSTLWEQFRGSDGGDVAVDVQTLSGSGHTLRYASDQYLGGLSRYEFDSASNVVNTTAILPTGGLQGMANGFISPFELNSTPPLAGQSQRLVINGLNVTSGTIKNITALNPITIVVNNSSGHGLNTGDTVQISGVNGVTGASGSFTVTYVDKNTFSLNGTNGAGVYDATNPGTWTRTASAFNGGAVYESNNAGVAPNNNAVTWTRIPTAAGFGSGGAMVYGGRLGGVDNPEVLYVASGSQLFLRSTAGGTLTPTPTAFPGGGISDIVLDPENWRHAYVADSNSVYETIDAGTTWKDLTGNLAEKNIQTIEIVASANVILVGGLVGVSRMRLNQPGVWTELGANLPNAVSYDLDYNANDDILLTGTFGRGVWSLDNASFVIDADPAINICGDEDLVNQDDTILLIRNAANPLLLEVYLNGVLEFSGPLAAIQQINVFGIGGNDNLIVDSTNGLIDVPTGIRYDGDGACPIFFGGEGGGSTDYGYDRGVDRLTLKQDGGPTQTSSTLSVGTLPGSGVSTIVGPAGKQQVYFEELEPVVDSVPATFFSLTSDPGIASLLDGDNAINYTSSALFDFTWARLTIDNYEPIEFTRKGALEIRAGAGSDVINLNNFTTPVGTTGGLAGIQVYGDDPTASDTLIVNSSGGLLDNLQFNPGYDGSGQVLNDVGPQPPINFSGIEHLKLVVQQSDGDGVRVSGTQGNDNFVFTPGASADSGVFRGQMDTNNASGFGPFSMVETTYYGVNSSVNAVELNSFFVPSGTDRLTYNATDASDTISIAPGVIGQEFRDSVNGTLLSRIDAVNIDTALVQGLGGDDVFTVNGTAVLPNLIIDGGEPSASDVLNLVGALGAVTVNLADSAVVPNTNTTVTGFGPTVTLIGVETANLGVNGNALTVNGTSLDDQITYTPTGTNSGTFTNAGLNTTFNFTAATGAFTIAGGAGSVADEVILRGTNSRDTIKIDQGARTAQVNALKTVTLATTIELLNALGLLGQDTFQVIPGAGLAGSIDNLIIDVDGGGGAANDALVVFSANAGALAANQFVVVKKNADITSGTVRVFTAAVPNPDINYTNINTVSPNVFVSGINPNLLILGPDNNDPNEFLATPTFLGSGSTLQIQHASIFPHSQENPGVPADQDFYRVVAQYTGTLDFQVYFRLFATTLLPQGGALNIQVFDAAGNVIGSAVPAALTFGALVAAPGSAATGDAGARVRIPAVAGQTYYLRVFGQTPAGTLANLVVNGYDATIINEPAPVAATLQLSRNVPAGVAGAPDTGDTPPNATNSDSGRSQFDNTTFDNTPTIFLRLDDADFLQDIPGNQTPGNPPIGQIPIPFNTSTALTATAAGYRIAVYDAGGVHNIDPNDPTFLGFAQPVTVPAGFPHLYTFTVGSQGVADSLVDGLHHLTARVQIIDPTQPTRRTGFGVRSESVDFVVDTAPPPVFFGSAGDPTDGLDPASDSGVVGQSNTFSDRITNVTVPSFFGTAEADSVIRLFIDANNNGVFDPGVDLQMGETVAVPLDGTNAYPGGQWTVRSTLDLNDPVRLPLLPHDGLRRIFVTAEDLAGNINPGAGQVIQELTIFLDTAGPQVTNVFITSDPTYNLFGLKPNDLRPTPLVFSLTIPLQDFPVEVAGFLRNAIQTSPGQQNPFPPSNIILPNAGIFKVQGDHNGVVSISSIVLTNNAPVIGQPATASVVLNFAQPLPDDRFTLSIQAEGLVDPAGNILDGESNAIEPNNGPRFPTGDGQPGGNFVARFTVDSRPEIGTYAAATIFVDINGNFVYDPDARNNDITNRDLNFTLQVAGPAGTTIGGFEVHDGLFAGNFKADNVAVANGFDKLAAYGFLGNAFRWLVDNNGDGVITPAAGDINVVQPAVAGLNLSALPISGNFNLAHSGDEVGLFDGTRFYLDTNANHVIDAADLVVTTGLRGTPIVGDFDGDGFDDLGTWRDDVFYFSLTNGVFQNWGGPIQQIQFGFPGNAELPVAADMDMDGIDDIGLFVPRRSGTTVPQDAEWYFLVSNFPARVGAVPVPLTQSINHPFSPTPLGHDIHAQFGDEFALPILGNFDPPVALGAGAATVNALDVNGDNLVNALDVLLVVNELNAHGTHAIAASLLANNSLDANRDNLISPLDALVIVNGINNRVAAQQSGVSALAFSSPSGQASSSATASPSAAAADAVFAEESDAGIDAVSILAADTALARVQGRGRVAGPARPTTLWDAI